MRKLPPVWRALSRALLPIAICGAVGAQELVPVPDPSIAESLKCLTGNEGKSVKYPEYERTTGRGGTVRVRLEFFSPVKGPLSSVLSAPSQALGDAVRWYVDDYRMPCLKKGKPPVVAIQEFSFDPRDGQRVTFAGLQRSAEAGEKWDKACKAVGVEHTQLTSYPTRAIRDNASGTVLASARFDGPGIAPEVTILNPGGHRTLEQAVVGAMAQIRIECTEPVDYWPRTFQQTYVFLIEGKARPVLKDLDLKQFVGAIDQLESHKARFDLGSMGCPFEVHFELYQPYAANRVGEVGRTDPNRQALLAWLESVSLRLPRNVVDQMLGGSMRIAVPCGLLDLTS